MAELPGARVELELLADDLRERIGELAERLTPGADLGMLFPREPSVVDRHEPPGFRYTVMARGRRPGGLGAPALVAHAADLLGRLDWDVTDREGDAEDAKAGTDAEAGTDGRAALSGGTGHRHVLTARHPDGSVIEVRVDAGGPTVLYIGRTPVVALYEPEEFRWPEPVRTPGTVTPGHLLCYECDGLGACACCGGRGWLPDEPHGRSRCPECATRRVCPICRGAGQLPVSLLSPYQRTMYPELDG
ncbi:hypothetical protein [Streptomyces sp. NPDC005012]|uniref:hypothetical protein n=1 Tax=Streptomyces sp. NPDC005012 TaxID=3154558 RepID=UPI0033B6566C